MKMMMFYLLFSLLPIMALSDNEVMNSFISLQQPNPTKIAFPNAVEITEEDLYVLSSSVLAADSWLRNQISAHSKITSIVVAGGVLCSRELLPSVENLYYSLVKWNLLKEIRLSVAFSECSGEDDILDLNLSSQLRVVRMDEAAKPMSRKLSSISPSSQFAPAQGTYFDFVPNLSPPELPADSPATAAFAPIASPPELPADSPATAASPPSPYSFAPIASPPELPANSPSTASPPYPTEHPVAPVPAPVADQNKGLWCVAKPSVPDEKLQEAMDYACGEGGADCEEIAPSGSCYFPDNLVAHASFAFNSYWQKTKHSGGTCSFDDTAILINSDPSSVQCQFVHS